MCNLYEVFEPLATIMNMYSKLIFIFFWHLEYIWSKRMNIALIDDITINLPTRVIK